MRTKHCLLAVAIATSLALVCVSGCHGKQRFDTGHVEQSFRNAPDPERTDVENGLAAIKAGDYSAAVALLDKVTQSQRLTPPQKESLRDLLIQLNQSPGTNPANASNSSPSGGAVDAQGATKATGDSKDRVNRSPE